MLYQGEVMCSLSLYLIVDQRACLYETTPIRPRVPAKCECTLPGFVLY